MTDLLIRSALVVDDDRVTRRIVARYLEKLGTQSIADAEGGSEALNCLDNMAIAPDLIVCDLNMPGMDGIEFLRHLAGLSYTGGVILLSGEEKRLLDTVHDLAMAHNLKILGTLEKPLTLKTLNKALHAEFREQGRPAASTQDEITASELEYAIKQGELVPYFQPQVDVHSCQVIGVEALVRWLHPERGMVPPISFVPLAEESGMIDSLTRIVYEQSVMALSKWLHAGLDLDVSVNMSVDNLHNLKLPDYLVSVADRFGVDVKRITLEITESRLVQDLAVPLDILTRLRLKGLGLSIDDFGTGFSSMEQLKRIPGIELKIDRSFVNGAAENVTSKAIFESSVALARSLKMLVVAEGVEDTSDWDFAKEHGCDRIQGYFVSRPLPATEVADFVRKWNAEHG